MDTIVITGGHHNSAIPVIRELRHRFPKVSIHWLGHKQPVLEQEEIEDMDIPFYDLKAGKFYQTYDPVKLLMIPFGLFHALYLLNKIRPQVILSFGGYLAVPTVLAAWVMGIPSVTHEQTATVGYANRLISIFAKKILFTWSQSLQHLPKHKSVMTGLPLREQVFQKNGKDFNIQNRKPTVFITTGKTGSHIINNSIMKILPELLHMANVIHQSGEHPKYDDFDNLHKHYEKIKTKVEGVYFLRKYIYSDAIGDAYGHANLVISRSGAHTCYEIMSLGKPCLLIPIPWSSHNEQFKNAKIVQEAGLAEIVQEDKIKDEKYLLEVIKEMLENIDQYKLKSPFEKNLEAARSIVDELLEIL